MNLSLYKPSDLEQWINQKYQEHGIHYASDMDIEHIASIFNVELASCKGPSLVHWDDDFCVIFLNGYLKEEQKREVFFHELCHPIKHAGNQQNMPLAFVELQEVQAAIFQSYAAVPVYMLEEFQNVTETVLSKVLAEEFRLPERLIQGRLEQIQRNILREQQDELLNARRRQKEAKQQDYTVETNRILDQLQKQLKKRA